MFVSFLTFLGLGLPPGEPSVLVTVHVPADALVYLNGQRMKSTSSPRVFQTPPLEPGRRYYYEVTVEFSEGQGGRRETRTLIFQAGDRVQAVFDGVPFPDREQIVKDLHEFYPRRYAEVHRKMKQEMLARYQEDPLRRYQQVSTVVNGSDRTGEATPHLLATVLNHRREQDQAILNLYREELETLRKSKGPAVNSSFIVRSSQQRNGDGQVLVTLEHLVITTDRNFSGGRISDFRTEKIHCLYQKQDDGWVLVRFW